MTSSPRVLVIYNTSNSNRPMGDPSVWYRCWGLSELLEEGGARPHLLGQQQLDDEFVAAFDYAAYDLYVFFRPAMTPALANFLLECDRHRRNVAASYDDLTFVVASWMMSSTLKSGQQRFRAVEVYRAAANAFDYFDRFVVSSPQLGQRIRCIKPHASVALVENALPRSYAAYADMVGRSERVRDRVGYFGGGKSHGADLALVAESLRTLCAETGARLLCPDYLTDFLPAGHGIAVERFERANMVGLVALHGRCRIAIAPLVVDDNAACKSSLKFVEAIAAHVPLVATPLSAFEPYRSLATLVEVQQDADWADALREAWDLAADRELVARERSQALAILDGGRAAGRAAVLAWIDP
ncbi:hypothetical protein [Acuticoccus sp.]|uniref:hypothetical protein n=1 Tax=Acuticoccus sp. TaxID=1904378 RepID=UPI003B5170A3